jgi:hypothetical protein
MPHQQPHARRAAVVGIASVVAEESHVVVSRNGTRRSVVLERKLSEHDLQVNASFMSSCVSNARSAIVRRDDKSMRPNVTRS